MTLAYAGWGASVASPFSSRSREMPDVAAHIDSRRVLARSCNQIRNLRSSRRDRGSSRYGGIGHGIVQPGLSLSADFGVEVLLESDGELQDGSCFDLTCGFGIEYEGVHVGLGRLSCLFSSPGKSIIERGERRRHARSGVEGPFDRLVGIREVRVGRQPGQVRVGKGLHSWVTYLYVSSVVVTSMDWAIPCGCLIEVKSSGRTTHIPS